MAIERDKSIVATEIVDALSNTVGYGTGKKISDFPSGAPTSNDKILFEQNGEGKSTTLADLPISTKAQAALNTKISGFSDGFGNKSSTPIFLPDIAANLMLFFSTFAACGLYVIRKESASAIFILPVKEAAGFTVTKGDNSVILNNSTNVGGVYTLIYFI